MRRAVLLLAALSSPADAGPWRGDFNVGYFIATPKFSDQDKRVRTANDDATFPEQHFQGLHLGVRAERDIATDIALTGEADLLGGFHSQAFVERLGVAYRRFAPWRFAGGIGVQQLILGSSDEGVGQSLHLNPLAFAEAQYALNTMTLAVRVDVVRVCANHGDHCAFGGGSTAESGFAFNMLVGSVLLGVPF